MTLPLNAPDSITKWVVQAIGVSDDYGFGVAEPVLFKVFKPIFVKCHIPYAFTRWEQSSLSCTIYNYNPVDVPVSFAVCLFLHLSFFLYFSYYSAESFITCTIGCDGN